MGWSGVEKGISSAALYSVSSTCRARGNHFSILHRLDFLPNVLSFSLECLCLPHSLTHSSLTSTPDSSLFCALFPSLCCIFLSLHLLNADEDPVSLKGTRDPFETCCTHTINTRGYSAAALKLSPPGNIAINQRSEPSSCRAAVSRRWCEVKGQVAEGP